MYSCVVAGDNEGVVASALPSNRVANLRLRSRSPTGPASPSYRLFVMLFRSLPSCINRQVQQCFVGKRYPRAVRAIGAGKLQDLSTVRETLNGLYFCNNLLSVVVVECRPAVLESYLVVVGSWAVSTLRGTSDALFFFYRVVHRPSGGRDVWTTCVLHC